jgi:hypothetical protein
MSNGMSDQRKPRKVFVLWSETVNPADLRSSVRDRRPGSHVEATRRLVVPRTGTVTLNHGGMSQAV